MQLKVCHSESFALRLNSSMNSESFTIFTCSIVSSSPVSSGLISEGWTIFSFFEGDTVSTVLESLFDD